jgi:hypothetical protein
VSSRLSQLLARPLAEHERQRAFLIAVVTLLVAAAALALTTPSAEERRAVVKTTPARVPASVPLRAVAAVDPPAVVMRAGRRFLADYLAYVYGRPRHEGFRAASASLRRRLTRRTLRVSPALRNRSPRIIGLTGRRLPSSRWLLTATIADGTAGRFPIVLVVATRPGGALVVELGEI